MIAETIEEEELSNVYMSQSDAEAGTEYNTRRDFSS